MVPMVSTPMVMPAASHQRLEQVAALGVGIGQRLAVVAARHAGADLRHLHQAVPQPRAVDPQVFPGCWHLHRSPCRGGAMLPLADDSFPDRMVKVKRTTT